MADIFISYKREDLDKARAISNTLTEEGYSVFFDAHDQEGIDVGEHWDQRLENELGEAKSVIVLWSKRSLASRHVRDEARRAESRNKLIPVLLEECEPPLGLGSLQAVNLSGWNGDRADIRWRKLVDSGVSRVLRDSERNPAEHADTLDHGGSPAPSAVVSFVSTPLPWILTIIFLGTISIIASLDFGDSQTSQSLGNMQSKSSDAYIETFEISNTDDEELVWLRTKIERNLVELLWSNGHDVSHNLTRSDNGSARFLFSGNISKIGTDVTVSVLIFEGSNIVGTVEVNAPFSDYKTAYRSLPKALLHFMNRSAETLEPTHTAQRSTNDPHAWWMFEEARRQAGFGNAKKADHSLDRALEIDNRFFAALWSKGDLLDSQGEPTGKLIMQEALRQNPDLKQISIRPESFDPMPDLREAAQKSSWQELEKGLSFRKFAAGQYRITVSAWKVDTSVFRVDVFGAKEVTGETADQIRLEHGGLLTVNGGFWDQDAKGRLTPSGLFISDGMMLKPAVEGAGSGLLLFTRNGPIVQYSQAPLPEGIVSGVQSGPIVVEPDGSMGITSHSGNRVPRTAACIVSSTEVSLIVVEGGLSLFELASLLSNDPNVGGFQCNGALNLDGGPSTQASFVHDSFEFAVDGLWKTQSALVVRRK